MFAAPRSLLVSAFLFAGTASVVCAADVTAVAHGDYALSVWETDDGLPHNSVAAVVQRADGFLWVATQGGLVRFDGVEFKPIDSPLINGRKSSGVAALIEEDRDTLLLATTQSGLVRWRQGKLSIHPLSTQLGNQPKVIALHREADGVFWVVFNNREVWRWHDGAVEKFAAPPALRAMWPVSFAQNAEGTVFLSRGAGIEAYANGHLRRVPKSPSGLVTIATSAHGGIWVGTGHRLSKWSGDDRSSFDPPWHGGIAPVAMFEDRHGALWLAAFEQGLIRWQDGKAVVIPISHVNVASLCDDDEGNLWIATNGGGLNRIQPTRLALVTNDPDWTDTVSGSVCEDALGNVWFGNRKGVRKIGANGIEVMNIDAGWSKRAMPIAADAAGNVWFGVESDLYRARADRDEPPIRVGSSEAGPVRAIYPARDGSVWIGRNSGPLMRYQPKGGTDSLDAAAGYGGRQVRSIGEDVHGHIWVGTEEGRLFEWNGARFTEPFASGGLPAYAIRAIYGDSAGNLWIGTAGAGLLIVRNGKLTGIGDDQGLPDSVISQLLEDDSGWIWFGSRRGLFKVPKADLLDCADGKIATVTPTSFGRADGLSGISAVGSYQPTACKTRSGQLYFVTRRGLVRTDPARHEGEHRLPRADLDGVRVDDQPVDLTHPRIRSSARKLEFRFTAPTYLAPERVRFRYRLIGFDSDWMDNGTQRFVTYPGLPPGRYVFTVTASAGDRAWNPQGASLAFTIKPAWWETGWARIVAAALAVTALVMLGRYWSHRRLKSRLARLEQEQRVEQERVRIARNLHDDLGASLTHASMMAEELAEDWTDLPDPQTRSAQLAERVRTIARDLDAVVWTVSPKNDSLASLAAYLSHFAGEYFHHSPIECETRLADDIPAVPLSPEVRHHLFMIAKELFNNVLKHSRAHHVVVTMQMAAGIFELVVGDDGRGFSVAEAEHSHRNGLKNLRARAAEAGGVLDFESTSGGTVATLQFRTKNAGEIVPAPRDEPHP